MKTGVLPILIWSTLTILCTPGCEQLQDQIKSNVGDDTVISNPNDGVSPRVVITDADENWGTDDYLLRDAAITDDTLRLVVSYSGGCEAHEFTLITSGMFLESSPVQLVISVAHNANDDPCEAFPTETVTFDLTGIKTLYQEAYQQDQGTIILLLENAPNGQLVYQFGM